MTEHMPILALDLSLTATGAAMRLLDGTVRVGTLKGEGRSHTRMIHAIGAVEGVVDQYGPLIVAIEGPAFGYSGGQQYAHEAAGMWWLITHHLFARLLPYVVIPPSSVKMYATGKGNASKDEVLLAVERRYGGLCSVADNNQADALAMLAATAEHYGDPLPCRSRTPALNARALVKIDWPDIASKWTVPA